MAPSSPRWSTLASWRTRRARRGARLRHLRAGEAGQPAPTAAGKRHLPLRLGVAHGRGTAQLLGPHDLSDDLDAEGVRRLLRDIFVAAVAPMTTGQLRQNHDRAGSHGGAGLALAHLRQLGRRSAQSVKGAAVRRWRRNRPNRRRPRPRTARPHCRRGRARRGCGSRHGPKRPRSAPPRR